MKQQIHAFLVTVYAVAVAVAVLAGAMVAVLFLAAFIVDGTAAAVISNFNMQVMNFSKKLACYAILFGLIDFYMMKEHHLTIDQNEEEETGEVNSVSA
ncbi:MAG: hypothetical protein QHH10_01095 [Peptococcaceae bacterium]|jgi:uncharacterized RDD family membrane protein YckC|nr:hypothetical protein [Peptococcaceae bacterium]MDH7523891.1 hypothetical protein [Peptococcaceae bacterium]